jgi:hypothetical protein
MAVNLKNKTSPKTRNSSALPPCVEIFIKNRGNEKVFGVVSRRRSSCAAIATAGRGVYTQN